MSEIYWMQPLKWNRKAAASGKWLRVFPSLCDIFDDEAPQDQRTRFWELTKATPNLVWLVLTKRPQNFGKHLPRDWGSGYRNVWLGVTAENRREAEPRIGLLRETPSVVKFVSAEPLLEDLGELDLRGIDWMIVGGESGRRARPLSIEWAGRIFEQCRA
jgi:protein gp37